MTSQQHAEFANIHVADSINGVARLDKLKKDFYSQFRQGEDGKLGIFSEFASASDIEGLQKQISSIYVLNFDRELPQVVEITGQESVYAHFQAVANAMRSVDELCEKRISELKRMDEIRVHSLESISEIKKKYNAFENYVLDEDAFNSGLETKKVSALEQIAKKNNSLYSELNSVVELLVLGGFVPENYDYSHIKTSSKSLKQKCVSYNQANNELKRRKKVAFAKSLDVVDMLVQLMFQNSCDSVIDFGELSKVNEYNLSAARKIASEIDYYIKAVEVKGIFPDAQSKIRYERFRDSLLSESRMTELYLETLVKQSVKFKGVFYEDRDNQVTLSPSTIAQDIMGFRDLPKLGDIKIPEFPQEIRVRDYRRDALNYEGIAKDLNAKIFSLESQAFELNQQKTNLLEQINQQKTNLLEQINQQKTAFLEQILGLQKQSSNEVNTTNNLKNELDGLNRRVKSYELQINRVNNQLATAQLELNDALKQNSELKHKLRTGETSSTDYNQAAQDSAQQTTGQQPVQQTQTSQNTAPSYNVSQPKQKPSNSMNRGIEGSPLRLVSDEKKPFIENIPTLEELVHLTGSLFQKVLHRENNYSNNVAKGVNGKVFPIDSQRKMSNAMVFNSLYKKYSTKDDYEVEVVELSKQAYLQYKTRANDFVQVFKALSSGFYFNSVFELHEATGYILEKNNSFDIPHIIKEINSKKPGKMAFVKNRLSNGSKESIATIVNEICG